MQMLRSEKKCIGRPKAIPVLTRALLRTNEIRDTRAEEFHEWEVFLPIIITGTLFGELRNESSSHLRRRLAFFLRLFQNYFRVDDVAIVDDVAAALLFGLVTHDARVRVGARRRWGRRQRLLTQRVAVVIDGGIAARRAVARRAVRHFDASRRVFDAWIGRCAGAFVRFGVNWIRCASKGHVSH